MFFRKRHKKQDPTDQELLRRFREEQDEEAFGQLFKRYMHLAYGTALKYLKESSASEDLVMEVFEKLMEDLPRFEVENFSAWLHKVTVNQCLMKLRKAQSGSGNQEKLLEELPELMENGEEAHQEDKEKGWEALERSLLELKYEQRHCLELFYWHNKTYEEVAEQTGYTLKAVKSYLQNGKRNLKLRLNRDHE